jgi:heme exporter protein D
MNWQSWSDFWYMGGYAVYVWGSMGAVGLLLILEVLQARWARAHTVAHLRARQSMVDLPSDRMDSE